MPNVMLGVSVVEHRIEGVEVAEIVVAVVSVAERGAEIVLRPAQDVPRRERDTGFGDFP